MSMLTYTRSPIGGSSFAYMGAAKIVRLPEIGSAPALYLVESAAGETLSHQSEAEAIACVFDAMTARALRRWAIERCAREGKADDLFQVACLQLAIRTGENDLADVEDRLAAKAELS